MTTRLGRLAAMIVRNPAFHASRSIPVPHFWIRLITKRMTVMVMMDAGDDDIDNDNFRCSSRGK